MALVLTLACGANSCAHTKPATVAEPAPLPDTSVQEPASAVPPVPVTPQIEFATQIRPILESRCQPCHFSGGIMYERLPFDRAETINALGTKVFSRIKDEGELALMRDYLLQQAENR